MDKELRHAPAFFSSNRELLDGKFIVDSKSSPDPVCPQTKTKRNSNYSRLFGRQCYDANYLEALEHLADNFTWVNNSKTSEIPAGFTYFGQFVAHELSAMDVDAQQRTATNARNARLDLDSVFNFEKQYAPAEISNAYSQSSPMPVGHVANNPKCPFDVQRLQSGKAHLADKRADDLLPLAQLNLVFLKLYNIICSQEEKDGNTSTSHETARRACTLMFQDVIWNEYLPHILDNAILEDFRDSGPVVAKYTKDDDGNFLLPIEFTSAIFRFGHSMVRTSYRNWGGAINGETGKPGSVESFFANTYASGNLSKKVLEKKWGTNWSTLFDFTGNEYDGDYTKPLYASAISTKLAKGLFDLPPESVPDNLGPFILAKRTLRRVHELDIASTQKAIKAANHALDKAGKKQIPLLTREQLSEPPFTESMYLHNEALLKDTPLWFYVLKEAEHLGSGGNHLGPFASRIIVETIYFAIISSKNNIFDDDKGWARPFEPTNGEFFRFADLIYFTKNIKPKY